MATLQVASRPETRATRPTGMGRAVTISLVGDAKLNSPKQLQVQRLRSTFKMSPSLAGLVAFLIYGGGDER